MRDLPDSELMDLYARGSEPAFEELFRRYEGRAYGYFLKRVACEARARDLYQELFLRLHRFRSTYQPKLPFEPWFFRVARSVMVDEWRQQQQESGGRPELSRPERSRGLLPSVLLDGGGPVGPKQERRHGHVPGRDSCLLALALFAAGLVLWHRGREVTTGPAAGGGRRPGRGCRAHGALHRVLLGALPRSRASSITPTPTTTSMAARATGKAHPRDEAGKELIRRVHRHAEELRGRVAVVYLENYDLELCKLLVSGVDLWLNTPRPSQEASGTSGMKAAHNGVPSLSVLDGRWIEGHIEGVTGWSIGQDPRSAQSESASDEEDARELYHKLATVIAPLYFGDRERWGDVMRHAIALNASFFNSHRMAQRYAASAYLR